MTTTTIRRGFGVFAVVVTVGFAGIAADAARAEHDASWAAPPEAAARVSPLAPRSPAVAGGAKLFHQRCATCHGEDGRGTLKAPDLMGADAQAQTDGALFWKITTGNTHAGMPAFSFLLEPQRWQLVLHLRALSAERRAVTADPSGGPARED